MAEDAGLELARVTGTGPDGRILRRDVEAAISGRTAEPAAPPAAPTATAPARPAPAASAKGEAAAQPLTRMRQAIARRMSQSKQTAPHYYLTLDIDMTEAMAFRSQLNASASEEQKVSVNDLVVKACALALERHPKFNAEFSESGLRMHADINIDIGIAMDEGLIAPAILGCAGKTLGQIARESKDLVARAKSGALRAEEYSDGTFTITNLGAYRSSTHRHHQPAPGSNPGRRERDAAARGSRRPGCGAPADEGGARRRPPRQRRRRGRALHRGIQSLLENPVSLAL